MKAPSIPTAPIGSRSPDEFLMRLGHALRGPLAPICNALYLLRRHPADPAVVVSAQEILDRQVRHLVHLVDDLLDMSRLAQGAMALEGEDVDLRQLVEEIVAERRPAFEAAELDLDARYGPGPRRPLWVRGDRSRLAQVLGTLLENALQFTPPGGRVSLDLNVGGIGTVGKESTGTESGQAVLEIRDTGIGIDPALLPGLFDRFAQADRTPAGKRGGLGLGLAVARGLVELHGGTLEVASPGNGQGSTFTLRLARVPEPRIRRRGEGARPTRPLRVVIIEDDLDSAESLGLLLQLLGHEVTVDYTGERGVAAVREKRPDVVLCDLGLPEMDGFEVARALRADPATAGCPLVAITGYGEEEDRRQAAAAGFEHHLVKPVDPDKLFELLAQYAEALPVAAGPAEPA